MFKQRGHGFFCRCDACKIRRRSSLWYMGILFSLLIILIWQVIFTIFITTKINAFLIFLLMFCVVVGFFRIIF
jgi:predicted neutral ceramidase superfamily lipid hydrolase